MKRAGYDSPPKSHFPCSFNHDSAYQKKPDLFGTSERVQLIKALLESQNVDMDDVKDADEPVRGYLTRDDYIHDDANVDPIVDWCIKCGATDVLANFFSSYAMQRLTIGEFSYGRLFLPALNSAKEHGIDRIGLAGYEGADDEPGYWIDSVSVTLADATSWVVELSLHHCDAFNDDHWKLIFEALGKSAKVVGLSLVNVIEPAEDWVLMLANGLSTSCVTDLTVTVPGAENGECLGAVMPACKVARLALVQCSITLVQNFLDTLIRLSETAIPLESLKIVQPEHDQETSERDRNTANAKLIASVITLQKKYFPNLCIVCDVEVSTDAAASGALEGPPRDTRQPDGALVAAHPHFFGPDWDEERRAGFLRKVAAAVQLLVMPANQVVMGEMKLSASILPLDASLVVYRHIASAPDGGFDLSSVLTLRLVGARFRRGWDAAYRQVARGLAPTPRLGHTGSPFSHRQGDNTSERVLPPLSLLSQVQTSDSLRDFAPAVEWAVTSFETPISSQFCVTGDRHQIDPMLQLLTLGPSYSLPTPFESIKTLMRQKDFDGLSLLAGKMQSEGKSLGETELQELFKEAGDNAEKFNAVAAFMP